MVRACFTLAAGNDTEHPYPLSIHGAGMFKDGLQQYIESTRLLSAHGLFDADECWLRTATASDEAPRVVR